jgi:hypothetical protein
MPPPEGQLGRDAPAEDPELRWIEAECGRVLGSAPEHVTRLTHSRVTRGVWRVETAAASAVVKVLLRPPAGSPEALDKESMRYWLREASLYAGGIPRPYLDAGVRGPALLARFDRPDGDVAL